MRVTQQEMDAGHQRIVKGAARLLRERGIRGTSVADAMNEAQMTHGGFYRHFKSKDDLVSQALHQAFAEFTAPLATRQAVEPAAQVGTEFKAMYLSDEHVQNPGQGCPMPAVGSELGRESPAVRAAFGAGLEHMIANLAHGMAGTTEERSAAATREMAMLVGALVLARASDPDTAQRVLKACRT